MRKPTLENLTPWPKGVSGNPKGGPSRKPIEDAFKEFLGADLEHKGKTKQRLEWLIERVFTDAMNGKHQAQALAFDRAFGKAKQDITSNGEALKGITVVVGTEEDKDILDKL